MHNWHIDCLSEYLEAVFLGQIQRLIINEPPRYMKSTQTTVCFPAWAWIRRPERRFIAASYAGSLSLKHSMDRRTLIESAWYQRGWGDRFMLRSDQNTKSDFQNDKRGVMLATSVGGASTGRGGDILIVDDPHDPRRAASALERETAISWFDKTFERRLDDKQSGAIVVVMQRLHQEDLTGHLLEKQPGVWTHLKLAAEVKKKTIIVFPMSKREVVRDPGSVMWPERESQKQLDAAKLSMQGDYEAQMNQDPVTSAGGFFPRSWWNRYEALPVGYKRKLLIVDCAEVPGVTNDYSVWAVVLEMQNGFYWKKVIRDKVGFPDLQQKTEDLYDEERPDVVIIENKSAGVQLIQSLQASTTIPIEAFNPGRDSKVIRASAAQPTVKSKLCWLPKSADWVEVFLSEHEKFPNDAHDDQVDTTSMVVIWVRENSGGEPEPRMREIG